MNDFTSVPFVDLALQHARISVEVQTAFDRVLKETSFVMGPEVAAFEAEFASFCGVSQVVGVGNGTDALEILLSANGIGPGHEVIVPANTFVATAEAVVRCGADLVVADCDEDYLIDAADVARRVSNRTRAVLAVHLYGQTAPVEEIRSVVPDGVLVLEDAAQAQGARRHGDRAGALGDGAATSFYPGKNLGAYGDAGALMSPCATTADLARVIRNHGGVGKYEHLVVGRNSRLDGLQAAVLRIKLAVLDDWNQERREAAARYDEWLADVPGVRTPAVAPGNEHVYHLYVVRVAERDRVLAALERAKVGAGIHYPRPVHLLPAFADIGLGPGDYPVSEAVGREIISLPMFPGISMDQQQRVVEVLAKEVR